MVVLHSKTKCIIYKRFKRNVFIPQFEHITNSRISKLPGLRSETPVTMHACTLLFSPPTGQRMKSADFYCDTEMGHIAGLLNAQEDATTPLQHKLSAVGKVIGLMALVICAIVFILEMIEQIKLGADLSKAWVDCFKTAIALAVAAIPEGLATVVTIVLAIGVGKMSKRNAIVKRLPAVETLGSCNVICSDKTGTLTQNKMSVQKIFVKDIKSLSQSREEEQKLLSYFAICSDASLKGKPLVTLRN